MPLSDRSLSALAFLWAALVGAGFGTLTRFANGIAWLRADAQTTGIMTVSYLILGPLSVGFFAAMAYRRARLRFVEALGASLLAILVTVGICTLFQLEGFICVLFFLPIALVLSAIGGTLGWAIRRRLDPRRKSAAICVAFLPFLLPQLEALVNPPAEVRTVKTQIRIHAGAEAVWGNIARVPAIRAAELPSSWTQSIGFPRPIEATLSNEGVGGVRHASFEHGLLFVETVTAWEPNRRLAFTIKADSEHIPPTTLDAHVKVGGRYFDVLTGEYRIEPASNGDFVLQLTSRERLSTSFNGYAAIWTDAVMRSIQKSILVVIKKRCQSQHPNQTPAGLHSPN